MALVDRDLLKENQPPPTEAITNLWLAPYKIDNRKLADYLTSKGVKTGTGKDPTEEGLTKVSGIETRYALQELGTQPADIKQTVPEIAVKVALQLINNRRWSPESIDELLFCTSYPFGEKGSQIVANTIGARNARTTDVYAACSGGAYALNFIGENASKGARVLIVAAEHYSSKQADDLNRTIFCDGGSGLAYVNNIDFQTIWSEVSYERNDSIRMPINYELVPQGSLVIPVPVSPEYFEMDGRLVYQYVVEGAPLKMISKAYKTLASSDANIHIIPHQASGKTLNRLGERLKKLGVKVELSTKTVRHIGNLASASVFAESHALFANQKVKKGDRLIIVGFGAGLSTIGVGLEADRDLTHNS